MTKSSHVRVVGLLFLSVTVLGYFAMRASPESTHIAGMWPVGLATGLLVLVRRRMLPWAAGALTVIAFATINVGGYPASVAAGYAVSIVLEGLVIQHVVLVRWGDRRRLSEDLDMGRYTVAALLGAATGTVLFSITAAATGFGVVWEVALATFVTHLASQLILLAFFMESSNLPGVSGTAERNVRWALVLGVTLFAFASTQLLTLLFFILPLLGWTALRASTREALWQLLTVGVVSQTLVQLGRGPFAALEELHNRPAELAVIPQQAFLLGCVLVCLPFAMVVSRQRRSATSRSCRISDMSQAIPQS